MGRRIALAAGGLMLVGAGLLAAFVLSMRFKIRPVQDMVRRMNRAVWNPRAMQTAGEPGAPAAVIHHIGRRSGTPYKTPVGAVPTEEGFVIALPYGLSPDWLKNVLAAGSTSITHDGATHRVEAPELVSRDDGNRYFQPSDQRAHLLFKVDDFLTLRRVSTD